MKQRDSDETETVEELAIELTSTLWNERGRQIVRPSMEKRGAITEARLEDAFVAYAAGVAHGLMAQGLCKSGISARPKNVAKGDKEE